MNKYSKEEEIFLGLTWLPILSEKSIVQSVFKSVLKSTKLSRIEVGSRVALPESRGRVFGEGYMGPVGTGKG